MDESSSPEPAKTVDGTLEARVTDMVIRLVALGLFTYWSLTLIAPFVPILAWAVILTVALYPMYEWLARRLGGRRGLAALLVTLTALCIVIGPIGVLTANLTNTLIDLAVALRSGRLHVPQPPVGIEDWPLIGKPVEAVWSKSAENLGAALGEYESTLRPAAGALLVEVASVGGHLLLFLLSVALSGFLFVPGPRLALGARRFAERIIRPRGAHFIDLAGATIRGVSRGVVGVAFLQAMAAGLVLLWVGVPAAGAIAFAVLVLSIIQIGPAIVLIPVIIWGWTALPDLSALVLTITLIPVMVIDNILRPILISRGLTTPILVILIGVLGGTIGYGLMGLFLGPIVLAVFYELVTAWVRLERSEPDAREAEVRQPPP